MNIIDKVEINYFRSVHSQSISNLSAINVFVGGNDAGKSNILKALNLFFNDETELEDAFDFLRDLSRVREQEARDAKGRMTVWIRITFRNLLKWQSLPDKFAIKKTWNRYEDFPTVDHSKNLSRTAIGRFLNKVEFHYIPAVRDRTTFSYFLAKLHDSLIDDERAGIRGSSNRLLVAINESTRAMSQQIERKLGMKSQIQVPEDLRDLFEALDFATEHNDYTVPLQMRGDGIQARHIPFILDFISRKSSRLSIWGFEEPENSLEFGKAFELANQFTTDFAKHSQIFLTTHSPAFYDLDSQDVQRFLVRSRPMSSDKKLVTTCSNIKDPSIVDEDIGIIHMIAPRVKGLVTENEELRLTVDSLANEVANLTHSLVLVEGISDKIILEAACEKLGLNIDGAISFKVGNNADGIRSALNAAKHADIFPDIPMLGIFDDDGEGRKQFGQLTKMPLGENFWEYPDGKKIFACLLPTPERILVAISPIASACNITIESLFPPHVIQEAVAEGLLRFEDIEIKTPLPGVQLEIFPTMVGVVGGSLNPEYHFLLKRMSSNSRKRQFAEWVRDKEAEVFRDFSPLLTIIRQNLMD